MTNQLSSQDVDNVIGKHLHKLRKPGVLTVRPGFEIAGHQATGKRAVVATVHTKKANVAPADRLPDTLDGVPVDVREASANQRLRANDPMAAALSYAYGRPEHRGPQWEYEREMPSGELLTSPKSRNGAVLADHKARNTPAHRALSRAPGSSKLIPYVQAPGISLDRRQLRATVTAHVSPDAGLQTLEAFLAKTEKSLVIGLYDFTSSQILASFKKVLASPRTLQMVLDTPGLNPTADQSDDETVSELRAALGNRAQIARALTPSDHHANAAMFPYAYHIKVIVRDGSVVWLSSGNLNNSNQPDLSHPPHTEDRDWHVIVENAELAKLFSDVLDQDFKSASQYQGGNAALDAENAAIADAHQKRALHTNPPPARPIGAQAGPLVAAQVFKDEDLAVTPLLTPDKSGGNFEYYTNIVDLISKAKKSIRIQLQYIESSKSGDYQALLQLLKDKAEKSDPPVKVELIESLDFGEQWAEKMLDGGVDLTPYIKLQHAVHNKGFIIDEQIAVVSSQNFSPAGIENNRDAGMILESKNIAQYFQAVFDADWNNPKVIQFVPKAKKPGATKKTPTKKTPTKKTPAKTTKKKATTRTTPAKKAAARGRKTGSRHPK